MDSKKKVLKENIYNVTKIKSSNIESIGLSKDEEGLDFVIVKFQNQRIYAYRIGKHIFDRIILTDEDEQSNTVRRLLINDTTIKYFEL